MPLPRLSIDELINTIKRSNIPTILVEGESDASIYRWIENKLGTFNGNILVCGGKKVILELYKRRNEFIGSKVIFLADKDMWLFTSVPTEYDEIIWTNGYSIENDLFTGDYSIELLFDEEERMNFNQMLAAITKWFAFEVEKFKRGGTPQFYHPQRILDANLELNEDFLRHIKYIEPNIDIVEDIRKNYTIKLRGKTLLELYAFILGAPKRKSKYEKNNIIELCLKYGAEKSKLFDIVTKIKLKFAIAQGVSTSKA